MSVLSGFPDCAPTQQDPNNPHSSSWQNCQQDCTGCAHCKPNPNSDCGQMMLGAGIDCVPLGCESDCCLILPKHQEHPPHPTNPPRTINPPHTINTQTQKSNKSSTNTNTNTKKTQDNTNTKSKLSKKDETIIIVIGAIGCAALLALLIIGHISIERKRRRQ